MKEADGSKIVKRARDGRYSSHPVCEGCRKRITGDHVSDGDTLAVSAAGMFVCERVRCVAKRDAMSVPERIAYYQRPTTEE